MNVLRGGAGTLAAGRQKSHHIRTIHVIKNMLLHFKHWIEYSQFDTKLVEPAGLCIKAL